MRFPEYYFIRQMIRAAVAEVGCLFWKVFLFDLQVVFRFLQSIRPTEVFISSGDTRRECAGAGGCARACAEPIIVRCALLSPPAPGLAGPLESTSGEGACRNKADFLSSGREP